MRSNAAQSTPDLSQTQVLSQTQHLLRKTDRQLTRKIWLPKAIYDALPYFYLLAGVVAFFTTLYISNWLWILPHYLLFSAACIHLGVIIFNRRRRYRKKHRRDDSGATA